MHISNFANKLWCPHCFEEHGTNKWPLNGDMVGFVFKKEPGIHSLNVICPHCSKEWYINWDEDPGPVRSLFS